MLKRRIIPVQLLLNGRLVKPVQFGEYRDVGNPISSSKVYSSQDADELVFLNIARENRDCRDLVTLIDRVSEVCFMPLTVGGGIDSLEVARDLIRSGADKIVLNSAAYSNPGLITQISRLAGSQAVMVSIDARWREENQDYVLYSDCGRSRGYDERI